MFGELGKDQKGWGLTRLGECCEVNPKRPRNIDDELMVSFVPMPAVSEDGKIDCSDIKPYKEVRKGFTYFAENDVLFAKITPCMENGKGAVAKGLSGGIGSGSTEFHVLRPIEGKSNPYWLYIITMFESFRVGARKVMTGTGGQLRVPVGYLSDFPISLPPISLQNSFEEFVHQSDKSKFVRFKSQFIEMFGDPATNSKDLPIATLPDLGKNLDNKRIPITGGDRKAGEYPYYGASGVVDYVADYIFDDDLLLISEDGANLVARVTPIAFPSTGKVWINNHAHVIKFNSMAMQCYVENLLNMMDISPYVTGTAQPKLNQAKLNSIPIPVPEEDQIREYLEFVKQSDKSK